MKAISVWKDGDKWYELRDDDGTLSHFAATRGEAVADGATVFVELDEPRFLVRDGSGRGWAAETLYSDFTADEREYRDDDDDDSCQTFGEWLDSSYAGDEYHNSDQMFTVIRIN